MTPNQRWQLLAAVLLTGCATPGPEPAPPLPEPPRFTVRDGAVVTLLPPAPLAETRGAVQSLVSRDAPFRDVVLGLLDDSQVNVIVDGDVDARASFAVKGATPEETFEALLRSYDLAYRWDGSFLRVVRREQRIFDVDYPGGGATVEGGGGELGGGGNDGGGEGAGSGEGASVSSGDTSGGSASGSAQRFWSDLEEDLTELVSDEARLLVNPNLGTVMVDAPPSDVERVASYIERARRRATRQVSIEAHVLEVQLREEYRLGVDFSILPDLVDAASDISGLAAGGGILSQAASTGADTVQVGVLKTDSFSLFVDALENQGQVRVISSPRVSTLHNVPAAIRVVEQVPVIEREIIDSDGVSRTQFNVRFEEAGSTVTVTPFIGEDDFVTCEVVPSITEVSGFVTTPDGLIAEPILNTRRVEAMLRVRDGQPIVLGGLRSRTASEEINSVPVLGDIPLIGNLFRGTIQRTIDTELVVVLFPRILTADWARTDVERSLDRIHAMKRPFVTSSISGEAPEARWAEYLLDHGPDAEGPALPPTGDGGEPAPARESDGLTRDGLARLALDRAMQNFRAGDVSQAWQDIGAALEMNTADASAWIVRACLEERRGDRNAARVSLRTALQHDSKNVVAANNLGVIELRSGNAMAAEQMFRVAADLANAPTIENNLGVALLAQGKSEAALTAFESALQNAPELADAHANRAIALAMTGQPATAVSSWRDYLRFGGDPSDARLRKFISTPAAPAR